MAEKREELAEFESVETFAEYLYEEERESFTYIELVELSRSVRLSVSKLIGELEGYGLRYEGREHEKEVRGFLTKNDRWTACPSHGGTGYEQISGFAGNAAR